MINNEWERSLDELNRTIQDAIDHQNYGRLNQNVTDTIGRAMEGLSRGLRNGIRYGSDAMNAAADNFAQRQRQAGNTPPFHNQGTGSAGGFTQNQGAGSAGGFTQNQRTGAAGGFTHNQGAGSAGGFAQDQRTGTAGNSVHRGGILYLKGTAIKVGGIFLAITGYLGDDRYSDHRSDASVGKFGNRLADGDKCHGGFDGRFFCCVCSDGNYRNIECVYGEPFWKICENDRKQGIL